MTTRAAVSLWCACLLLLGAFWDAARAEPIPGTRPLNESGDLAAKQVAGIHKYLDRELNAVTIRRKEHWNANYSSANAYTQSISGNRHRLRKILGVVDQLLPPRMEFVGGPDHPALVAETDRYRVYTVRWAVLPGIHGEGLWIEPTDGQPLLSVVAIPDATNTPEQIVGLMDGVPPAAQFARRLAENNCRVIVPALIGRDHAYSANHEIGRVTNIPHREFLYRMAYQMGRHLIGYEVQKVIAAFNWLEATAQREKRPNHRLGLMGHGEGGRIALYTGAIDDRISTTSVSAAFGPRHLIAEEPIDRNVWGLLTEFGDAEIAAFCYSPAIPVPGTKHHKRLLIEVADAPRWTGPALMKAGRNVAAPGLLNAPDRKAVESEFARIEQLVGNMPTGVTLVTREVDGRMLLQVPLNMEAFLSHPPIDDPLVKPFRPFKPLSRAINTAERDQRQFHQIVTHIQKLWRDSESVRKTYWSKADASSPQSWENSCETYRDYFHSEIIGRLPEPTIPINPRTRLVFNEPTWTGHEVILDVYPDVFALGMILVPRNLKPGEKRPVVVCQHGLEGTPRSTIDAEKSPVYAEFSKKLVEQGYIVYAPQNPYYGRNEFRQIQRKANPLKLSLFSFIIRQHQRTLDWLVTLPHVDPKRIGFYGLSYGGKTAMRVPAVEKRYCLSICSGDFNEWIGKNVSVDLDRSYMWTGEYEMYEFDLGNTFNYAEMAHLIAPRPFMVERGHDDGVGTDEMVSYEYAKVRYLYANRLKIADRTEIEYQPGGHRIFGLGTYAFLKKHLNWNP